MIYVNNKQLIISLHRILGFICLKSNIKQLLGQYMVHIIDFMNKKQKRKVNNCNISTKHSAKGKIIGIKNDIIQTEKIENP